MENNYIKLPIIEYHLFQSNTGMKLLLIPNDEATIISYGMYISVGSLDETDDELGIAHFLEHMMFKGSTKYPNTSLINRLDELGTNYNATTSFESTDYEIHGLPQYHEELLTIIIDMYFNPSIPPDAIENERKIILEEYDMRYDNKFLKLYLNLINLITKEKNKLYARPIIGTKDSINKIQIDDGIFIEFDIPKIKHVLENPNYTSSFNDNIKFISSCITKIQNNKQIINKNELSFEEIKEFMEQLTTKQFKKITDYFDSLPRLFIQLNYITSDGTKKTKNLTGTFNIINFFFDHISLHTFYQLMFQMKYFHNYSIEEYYEMLPWQRQVLMKLIIAELEKEKKENTNYLNA